MNTELKPATVFKVTFLIATMIAAVFGQASIVGVHGASIVAATKVDDEKSNVSSVVSRSVNGKQFQLKAGWTIELVAGPPMVSRPINVDFDDQGRLYVTESSGTNENVQEQLKKKPHRILQLVDSDGDGIFDKRTVFADQMMFPEGAMWFDGSLYVAAPPQIWKLTDTNDDGVADKREVWFDGKTLTGCANDLHGPYLGPDGWIYWCKGAFAEQTYSRNASKIQKEGSNAIANQQSWVTRASHIFRRRPEGGPVEAVMTGGMDNPVELVFMPNGERIFNATFLHHPHDGKRDGLVHAIYGGVYGKEHGVLEGHPRTGDLMPVLVDQDASAPSGLIRIQSNHFGAAYRDNVLCTSFNMHKVMRHPLSWKGSMLTASSEDFVVCQDLDFHPTDIVEDADGSILIVDTGGWYKLCCPTSQLHKPDILGGIYRVRRTGAPKMNDPRGLKLDWSNPDIGSLFGDARFAVRKRAQWTAARQNRVEDLKHVLCNPNTSERVRLSAVWSLSKISQAAARNALRIAIQDKSERVRQAAAHAASVWKDAGSVTDLCELLKSRSMSNRRVAAEALGRMGHIKAVPVLLEAASQLEIDSQQTNRIADRALEHSIVFALIELGYTKTLVEALNDTSATRKHVALMALSEIDYRLIPKQTVLNLLDSSNGLLKSTAWRLVRSRTEWADGLVDFFDGQLRSEKCQPDELLPFLGNPRILELVKRTLLSNGNVSPGFQLQLVRLLGRASLKGLSEDWNRVVKRLLKAENPDLCEATLSWIKSGNAFKPNGFTAEIKRLAAHPKSSPRIRLLAFSTIQPENLSNTDVQFLAGFLANDRSSSERSLAMDSIEKTGLNAQQTRELMKYLSRTGPREFEFIVRTISRVATKKNESADLGQGFLEQLKRTKLVAAFPPDKLRKLLGTLSSRPGFQQLLSDLERAKTSDIQRMEAILALIPDASRRNGQAIFHSNKASCIACHQMGYLGGRIGPSLSRIGKIRSERDLLESLMFPNLSFVRSYEPVVVETVDGKIFSGIIKNETASFVELTLDAEKSVRIAKEEIENRKTGQQSIMPSGLHQQFEDQELADLIRFLKESG